MKLSKLDKIREISTIECDQKASVVEYTWIEPLNRSMLFPYNFTSLTDIKPSLSESNIVNASTASIRAETNSVLV